MTLTRYACGAIAAAVAMLTVTAPTVAQHRVMAQSKSGPFIIDYITEGGKFDRCAATLSPGPNMLRIAYNRYGEYAISVPGVPVPAKTMEFYLNGMVFTVTPQTDPKRVRAWSTVDYVLIDTLKSVRNNINIKLGAKNYNWPIGVTNMRDVIAAMEKCTNTAIS